MRLNTRFHSIALAAVLLSPTPLLCAQTVDAVGHYEGSVSSPAGELTLEIDLTRTANGQMAGTLTIPMQKLKGLPLSNVVVSGKDVSFDVATSGGGYFRGELDEKGISGEFSMQGGGFELAFARAGAAHTYAVPASAAIGKELEGQWKGTLDVDGGMRVIVNLANHPDGTSSGTVVSVDENNLTVPAAIAQDGAKLTL